MARPKNVSKMTPEEFKAAKNAAKQVLADANLAVKVSAKAIDAATKEAEKAAAAAAKVAEKAAKAHEKLVAAAAKAADNFAVFAPATE
jgi:hypothetical protein